MTTLRTLTYVVKMDVGDGKVKAKDFRLTLQTMQQDATKASASVDKLAKSIGEKYGVNVQTAVDETRTVKNEINRAAREAARAEKNYDRLSKEYALLASRTGKTAEEQEILNAQYRLGAGATQAQKDQIAEVVRQYQAQRAAATQTQGSMRAMRGQAQNLGYQLQDVAVQLQMGTDAMVVFSQQGSQLAAGFGAKGALIGAVIAVAGAVGGVLYKAITGTGDKVKDFTTDIDKLKDTLTDIGKLSDSQLSVAYIDLSKRLNQLSKQQGQAGERIADYNRQLDEGRKKILTYTKTGVIVDYEKMNKKAVLETRVELERELATLDKLEKEYKDVLQVLVDVNAARQGTQTSTQRKAIDETIKALEKQVQGELYSERAIALSNAAKQKATAEDFKRINAAYDIIESIEAEREAEEARQKAAEEARQAAKRAADEQDRQLKQRQKLEAELTQAGALDALERQYKIEQDLLKGNNEALVALEDQYNNERLKITGTFWEQYAAHAKENILEFDDLVANSLENFTTGFGNAFADAIFESTSLADAMQNVFTDIGKSMVAFFAEWAAQKLLLWALDKTIDTGSQAAAVQMTAGNAAAGVNMAAINAYQSAAAIPYVGWMIAPAAAATAAATTGGFAAAAIGAATSAIPAYDKGGVIPSGGAGIVSEIGDELVGGTMVYNGSPNSVRVTGREDTARMMGGNTSNTITVNNYGNASSEAIARSVARALKKKNKRTDTAIYDSMNRGRTNRGKRFA